MAIDLVPIPPVPRLLREAALTGRLVPFIGAGASRLAGCPGWDEFADGALRQLIDQDKFTYSQLDQIKHLTARVKLSIAAAIAADVGAKINYELILHPRPRSEHAEGRRMYKSLFALGNVFVTTNYDLWLDDRIVEPVPGATAVPNPDGLPAPVPMHKIHKVEQLLPDLTRPNTVIHLHGSVEDPGGMVLTTHHYMERYANDRRSGPADGENRTLTFLEHLFAHYTVLFIGYGLEELEILEYVIRKAKPRRGSGPIDEPRHFILQGFFSHEETLRDYMEAYYRRECGVQLIGFLRDQKDYRQLLDVVEQYAREIPASPPPALVKEQTLEELAREMEPLT